MKKKTIIILLLFVTMISQVEKVQATDKAKNPCVDIGTCQLLCEYNLDDGAYAHIYAYNEKIGGKIAYFTTFSWSNWDDGTRGFILNGNSESYISGKKIYYIRGEEKISGGKYTTDTNLFTSIGKKVAGTTAFSPPYVLTDEIKNFKCPQKVYKDTNGSNEICFDNADNEGEGHCAGIEKVEICIPFTNNCIYIRKFSESTKAEVVTFDGKEIEELFVDVNLKAVDAIEKIKELDSTATNDLKEVCVFGYSSASRRTYQYFVTSYLNDNKFRYFKYIYDTTLSGESIEEIVNDSWHKIDIDVEKYAGYCAFINKIKHCYRPGYGEYHYAANDDHCSGDDLLGEYKKYDIWTKEKESPSVGEEKEEIESCQNLIGDKFIEEINSYLLYFKVAVPIIIIVMGSIDFGIAIISTDEDKMKKAQKKFITRLLIGAVIFFIPVFINVLLNIANQIWGISSGTCGIEF